MHTYRHANTHTHTHTHTHPCAHAHTHRTTCRSTPSTALQSCRHDRSCTRGYTFQCRPMLKYIYIYIYVYVDMHTHTYICTCKPKWICTHTHSRLLVCKCSSNGFGKRIIVTFQVMFLTVCRLVPLNSKELQREELIGRAGRSAQGRATASAKISWKFCPKVVEVCTVRPSDPKITNMTSCDKIPTFPLLWNVGEEGSRAEVRLRSIPDQPLQAALSWLDFQTWASFEP